MKTIKEINKNITEILKGQFVDRDKDGGWGTEKTAKKITQQILSLIEELEGKLPNQQVNSLCNSVIMVADKFINKCKTGRARSVETLSDMLKIKQEAEMLKESINL